MPNKVLLQSIFHCDPKLQQSAVLGLDKVTREIYGG